MKAFIPSLLPLAPPPRKRTRPTCTSRPTCALRPPEVSPTVQRVADRLAEELPDLFSPSSGRDFSLYSKDVVFEDPLNKFTGISRYASNINFLGDSPVFSNAGMTIHDIAVIKSDTVRTRWTLSMIINLPWAPCVAFTGQSDYVVDSSGMVVRHIDYWDSLSDSAFFSIPAVGDLLSQCRPHIGPRDLGGFQLLRRTDAFEIRRFDPPVSISQTRNVPFRVCELADRGDSISSVAVAVLPKGPRNQADVDEVIQRLRADLERKPYATAGARSYYVRPRARGNTYHEVWLQLSEASAVVDD